MLELWPADVPVVIRADGLVLREWTLGDLASLVALHDTAETDRRTPVAVSGRSDDGERYGPGVQVQ